MQLIRSTSTVALLLIVGAIGVLSAQESKPPEKQESKAPQQPQRTQPAQQKQGTISIARAARPTDAAKGRTCAAETSATAATHTTRSTGAAEGRTCTAGAGAEAGATSARAAADPAGAAEAAGSAGAAYAAGRATTATAALPAASVRVATKMGWAPQGAWQAHSTWQQDGSQRWASDHRNWAQRGGYGGSYIPQASFNLSFGMQHSFRMRSLPTMYMGYPRFAYGGYSFLLVDPFPGDWAANWYDSDNLYITYDNGYYLYDSRYPSMGPELRSCFWRFWEG